MKCVNQLSSQLTWFMTKLIHQPTLDWNVSNGTLAESENDDR